MSDYTPTGPSQDDLIAGLAKYFDAPEAVVISWITMKLGHTFDARAATERLAARQGGGG